MISLTLVISNSFAGIVTLQDVLESVLQERIYDEEDIAQRHLAGAGKRDHIRRITCYLS
jgi:CBS domain containing-hemolysin-like protein